MFNFYSGVNQLTTSPEREMLDKALGLVRQGGIYPEHLIRQALSKAMQGAYGTTKGIYEQTAEELARRGLSRSGLATTLPAQRMQNVQNAFAQNMLQTQLANAASMPQLLEQAMRYAGGVGDIWRTGKAEEQKAYAGLLSQVFGGLLGHFFPQGTQAKEGGWEDQIGTMLQIASTILGLL